MKYTPEIEFNDPSPSDNPFKNYDLGRIALLGKGLLKKMPRRLCRVREYGMQQFC